MLTPHDNLVLMGTPLFCGLEQDALRHLLERSPGTQSEYRKDQDIFTPESFQRGLGILLAGRLRVTKNNGELVVSVLSPGDLFGAATLYNDEARYASTLTARADSRVLFFSQTEVSALIDESSAVRENYIRYLSGRIRFLSAKVDALACGTGEKKVALFLLDAMDENGKVSLSCTLTELAARLNIGRTSLYREIAGLEEKGILRREGKQITVLCPDRLK